MQNDNFKRRLNAIKKYYSKTLSKNFDLCFVCDCAYDILTAKYYQILDNADSADNELVEDKLNLLSNLQIAMYEISSIRKYLESEKFD